MLLCISIPGPDTASVHRQISQATELGGMVELRVDLFDNVSVDELVLLKKQCSLPVMVSLRSQKQGGKFTGDEASRRVYLRHLAALQPELLDVELGTAKSEVVELKRLLPNTNIVVSYHSGAMPEDLDLVLHEMQQLPADYYKIAALARHANDSLRMMNFVRSVNVRGGRLTGLCMGEDGQITRVLGPVMGVPMTFASLGETLATAPGQLSAQELHDVYHQQRLTFDTKPVALIGYPLGNSYLVHNAVCHELDLPTVYLRMPLKAHELPEFFYNVRQLPFRGFSVTMPLKEAVIPYLDTIDPTARAIGAVNTIVKEGSELIGYNFDGMGALDAVEARLTGGVRGKTFLILGAGGAAKAVAYEAKKRGAKVTIVNRTDDRARELADRLDVAFEPFHSLPELLQSGPDVLAQMTSVGMRPNNDETLVNSEHLHPRTLVLDGVMYPSETRLLREAKGRGCAVVAGRSMWEGQAVQQILRWFGSSSLSPEVVRDAVRRAGDGRL